MNRQIIVIHGGNTFHTYEEYLADLKAAKFDAEDFKDLSAVNWKQTLGKQLGKGFGVIAPRMPNSMNAKYLEWKIWFDKLAPFFNDGAVLVGHSLGGIFLAKYLTENRLPHRIKATMLVAAPFNDDPNDRTIDDFVLPKDLKPLSEQSPAIYFYHSTDDPVVEYTDAERYVSKLPNAQLKKFTDRGHFFQDSFPEIVSDIKKSFK